MFCYINFNINMRRLFKTKIWENISKRIEKKRIENNLEWRPVFILKDLGRSILNPLFRRRWFGTKVNDVYFIHTPKVAGSSINYAFTGKSRNDYCLTKKEINKLKCVAFVRNPFDRLVSCHAHWIKNTGDYKKEFVKGLPLNFWRFNGRFYPNMTFKEFVKVVCSIEDKKSESHFESQISFLSDRKGELIPDYICKFENLKEDFENICNKLKIKPIPDLPVKNKSKRKKNFMEYYDDELKELVRERYKKDFEVFGYEKS